MTGERSHFVVKPVRSGGTYTVEMTLVIDPLPGQETFAQQQTWRLAPSSARFLRDKLQAALDQLPDGS